MFPKQTFGANASSFGGSFNTGTSAASPFSSFKPTTGTSAFGATPTFGAGASAQPATGGGLFGSTNTTGGLFGGSTTAAPAFGGTSGGFGFGANTSSGGGLFASNTGGGLFGGTQNNAAFGAKPAGFGFGGTATTATTGGGLFGSSPAAGTGLFGQQSTTTLGGGGLFSNNAGAFGQQPTATGTAHVKYNPVVGSDVVVKSGASQNISIKHHCITVMKEYENKSLEELRLEDYQAGRKGSTAGVFGGFQQPAAENKPLFGGSSFGQPATTTASNVFGAGGGLGTTGGFGQTNTFSFGSNAQNNTNTTGLFGAAKPAFGATSTAGGGLFGAATTQAQAPTFGAGGGSFGFGANTQSQPGGLFGAKPATTGFGAAPASTGFGAFAGGGGLFGAKPQQSTAPAFGSTAPAFGSVSGGFGASTSTAGGGLFSAGGAFGKPATSQPTFGFNAPNAGLGLGAGLGANSFQNKPAGAAFGTLGGGSLFATQQAPTFSSGLDSGLGGGGLFGNNSSLGLGNSGLGNLGANNAMNNNNLSGSVAGNVHEQILNLVARPYGESPLFKDIIPNTSTTAENALKPTNPAAVKAVLDSANSGGYRVTSPNEIRLKVQPRALRLSHDKKSLFDGLEESDASLEDKLSLKPSRKRLVLRPKSQTDEQNVSQEQHVNRSLEDGAPQYDTNGPSSEGRRAARRKSVNENGEEHRIRRDTADFSDNNNLENSSDRHGSWLNASKHQWSSEKEKSIDDQPTPRLYPNLDKEISIQSTACQRRASWLTTKPAMRKPLASNPDAVESSVRDLGVRPDRPDLSHDKENVDTFSVSEEENVAPREAPPHPTRVKLTRPGYYTIPTLDEMIEYMRSDGTCVVPHLTIGRRNYGNVYYDCEIDVAGLDLDALVHFLNKEVTIYPDDSAKPPVGEGLNRRAIVTLDRIWPRDKTEKKPITDPDRLLALDYEGKLRRVCDKHDTKFIEYRPQTGSWVFRVEHFSKYSLTDSDEEDDPTPEVMKRQLVNQQLQKAAPPAPPKPPAQISSPGLGGLGGLGGIGSIAASSFGPVSIPPAPAVLSPEDNLFAMQQTSLNLLDGASKAFDMDTTEENTESQSLYQDSHKAYGVKSPTSELARLEHRQSHNVQLMKASLYTETEMEDDVSVSTGDQTVPGGPGRGAYLLSAPARPPSAQRVDEEYSGDDVTYAPVTEEAPMRPLIVRPHTVVLKYHRKVPPFKQTIAGRLGAAQIADMSVCRARHSRAGFGPSSALVYATSYDSVCALPRSADLCELGTYVRGRMEEDWSEPVVARLALGQADSASAIQETLVKHLETLLQFSSCSKSGEESCPRLAVLSSPGDRLATLQRLLRNYQSTTTRHAQFGVSSSYCHEVFKLCEALWGADLENDGIPGTDEQSIVNRHRRLLEWLAAAVAQRTDHELSEPRRGETADEEDGHSSRIWTLLLGGRVLEACKVARQNGDLHMATLIAQAAGDPTFRSLVGRQLSIWRECGADALVSAHRLAALQLLAGLASPRDELQQADWLRAFHATARYLCPQVPSLEQVVRTYESLFSAARDCEVDLSLVDDEFDDMGMRPPLPPYLADYTVTVCQNGKQRRVLDLRYELIRARAMNVRPKMQPAAYTPDPMDYSLCFLLGAWFGNPTVESITGMADQLEACGAWHLAVLALCYHPDDRARGHLVRGVLSRHAPAQADTADLKSRLQIIRRLKVPEKWLLLAQAHRAKYEQLSGVEAELLAGAEQWNAAHAVLLEKLLPDAVLADNLQSISSLLERLNEAAQRHEVSGWESGGQALHHYLHVCDEIRGLVSAEAGREPDRASVHTRLEALRPRVAAACRALGRLAAPTPRHAAARTEMGARLVQLALAAGEPAHHLASLLAALRLPPDSTAHAQYKITTDLAEQASNLCIESASSSPLSSHHRATVQS